MRALHRAIFLGICVVHAPHADAKPPNVVLIISDDQGWTDYGFQGHPTIRTPHLNKLAAQSAQFTRGYVPSSLCRPSLATLISGLYPHQHQITGNDPPRGADRTEMLRHIRRIPTLPHLLTTKGYASFQSGKWWEGGFELGGFTAGMTHGDPARGGRHGDDGLRIGREVLQPVFDFIAGCGEKPFFVWYAPILPHTPHNPPERLLAKYRSPDRPIELARYYAMCEWFDETCGLLLDHLDEQGLADDTLVVYITDNGWMQRTPETKVSADWRQPFAPRSKRSPYEMGIRTPVMLRWPGRIRAAKHETLVHGIDVAPTILAAAGVEIPRELPGLNLLEVVANDGRTSRPAVFGEVFTHDVADLDNPTAGLQYRWCIRDRWKVILPVGEAAAELYDLKSDPHETMNLVGGNPHIVAELARLTDEWWPGNSEDDETE